MKRAMVVLTVCLIVMGVASAVAAQSNNLVLATGGTAGTYYPFGGAMAKIWNSKIPGMNVTAQATGASAENIRLVNRNDAELAIVQSDTIDFAYNGKESFKEPLKGMTALAVLYPEIIQVVVRGEGKVKSFDDLRGLKVGVGAPGSGTEANFRQLCDAFGMKKEDVNAQYLSFSESAEQFKDNHIDAFLVTAGIPNAAIMDISTQHSVRIINIDDAKRTQLVQKYPFLSFMTIPANTYRNQSEDVKTVAVNAVLIAGAGVKDDVAYNLVKTLFENVSDLSAAHAKGKELNLKAGCTGVSIPFHPGAVKYYKEKGAM